jgi:arsenate reductase
MKAKIYHNPRCSKSRATLALLQERGIETEVIEYLKNPLQVSEIESILRMLGAAAPDLLRTGEPAFADSGLTPESPADQLIALMAATPAVIERPIVVIGDQARLGRPPERVLELLA